MPKRSDIQKPKCLHKHIQIATPTHNYILNRDRIIPKDRNQSYLPKPAIIRSSDTETDTIDTLRRTRHLDVTVTTALLRSLPPLSEPPPSYCSRPPVTQSMVASTAGSSLRHGCHPPGGGGSTSRGGGPAAASPAGRTSGSSPMSCTKPSSNIIPSEFQIMNGRPAFSPW